MSYGVRIAKQVCRGIFCVLLVGGTADRAVSQIVIGDGSSLDLGGGALDAGCLDVEIAGELRLVGGEITGVRALALPATGLFEASNGVLSWSGDWVSAGQFEAGSSTAAWIDGCGSAISTLSGELTFHELTLESTVGRELRFGGGETTTITQGLTVAGAPGQLLRIRTATPGVPARIALDAAASQSISAVDVAYNMASAQQIGFPGPAANYDGSVKGEQSSGWFELGAEPQALEIPTFSGWGGAVLGAALLLVAMRRLTNGTAGRAPIFWRKGR